MYVEIAKLFLQLGVAGAALYILYHLINKLFEYLDKRTKGDNKVDKLCEKIDKLVDVIHVSSSKTNELVALNNQMQNILKTTMDISFKEMAEIHSKVDKIEVKTSQCLK
jgi:hypothetical protein